MFHGEGPGGDDTYEGALNDEGALSGLGVYTWSNGDVYDGAWLRGLKHGRGAMRWSGGGAYIGEWWNDAMHGVGELTAGDGTHYRGSWDFGAKQGLGRQTFPNGDTYEGLWKEGRPHGPGLYKWAGGAGAAPGNGSGGGSPGDEYNGEWSDGTMCGWGTLVFAATDDRYDGEWADGHEHGNGVYTWGESGATFSGTWRRGRKHGPGIWAPALQQRARKKRATERTLLLRQESDGGAGAGGLSAPGVGATVERGAEARHLLLSSDSETEPGDHSRAAANMGHISGAPVVQATSCGSDTRGGRGLGGGGGGKKLLLCEYENGAMIREESVDAELAQRPSPADGHGTGTGEASTAAAVVAAVSSAAAGFSSPLTRGARADKVRQVRAGETIFKGHRSYELMLQLQLGVRWSVGRDHYHAPLQPWAPTSADFERTVAQRFPRGGGAGATPPHPAGDFAWKDYSPAAFRRLRQLWGVDSGEYMLSLCGDHALRELSSPGGVRGLGLRG